MTTQNQFLAKENYCQLTIPIPKEVIDYIYDHGFKMKITAGSFKIASLSHVQVEDDITLQTGNTDKDGEATIVKGHQLKGKTVMSIIVRFKAVNPGFITASSIFVTFTKRYNREILLMKNTGTSMLNTIKQELAQTMSLALGWGVKVPSKIDTGDLADAFKLPEKHPFAITASPASCTTSGQTECLIINTMTYEFQIDNEKYVEGFNHKVRIYFAFGSAQTTGARYTLYSNSIHTNMRIKHVNTAGTTTSMTPAQCAYHYMAASSEHNYIEC